VPAVSSSHGVLAYAGKDHVHVFNSGFAYASRRLVTRDTMRPTGVILLTVDGEPFTVTIGGRRLCTNAVALSPNTRRDLDARGVGLVSINLVPSAKLFPAFRSIPAPGALVLERSAFRAFDDFLAALHVDGAAIVAAPARFAALVATAVQQFPTVSTDARWQLMLASLTQGGCSRSTLQTLADRLGLSYHRTSHLFSATLGITLKSYLAWQKQMPLYPLLLRGNASLTEIAHAAGLPDSAYLSRLYQRLYGQRPSFIHDSNLVQASYWDARYDPRPD